MHKERAPCLLIKDTENRIGIMTHTDIVYKVVAQGLNPDDVESRRVMSLPVRSVEFDQPLETITTSMASSEVPLLIVTRQQQPIGVISAHDLVNSPTERRSRIQATLKAYNQNPEGVSYPAVITQLSHVGAFLDTAAPVSPGARITLEFVLPDSKRPIAVEAAVLEDFGDTGGSVRPLSSSAASVGVRFTDVSLSDQAQISTWVIRTRSKKPDDS